MWLDCVSSPPLPLARILSNPQVSAVRSRRSSDKTLFVRTHVSKYFVSILICNLLQSIGGLLNIPYIIESRVYTGVSCTVQGFLKQLGNVRKFIVLYGEGCIFKHLVTPVWHRYFLFCHCRPHLQRIISSSPVVGPCMLHRPHFIMGSRLSGIIQRVLHPRQTGRERTIFWNCWPMVLDHSRIPIRTIFHIVPHHVHLGGTLLHPLCAHILPATREYYSVGWIQNQIPTAPQSPSWQDERWRVRRNR